MADVSDVLREVKELRRENKDDHASLFGQLAVQQVKVAVIESSLKNHKDTCEKKHGFLNKILWAFASVLLLSAGAMVLKAIIDG